jgi:hypothetical protein
LRSSQGSQQDTQGLIGETMAFAWVMPKMQGKQEFAVTLI